LMIAPTGEMMSWQTRLQSSAARSSASSSTRSANGSSELRRLTDRNESHRQRQSGHTPGFPPCQPAENAIGKDA